MFVTFPSTSWTFFKTKYPFQFQLPVANLICIDRLYEKLKTIVSLKIVSLKSVAFNLLDLFLMISENIFFKTLNFFFIEAPL